jgi:hypothetical protein
LFDFTEEEIWFFVGVVVVWYLIGRMVDRRRIPSISVSPRLTIRKTAVNLMLAGFGIFLLVVEVLTFSKENHAGSVWFYPFYEGVFWILLFLWSVILVIFPALALAHGIRYRPSNAEAAIAGKPTPDKSAYRYVWSAAEMQAKNEGWQMVCANVFGL